MPAYPGCPGKEAAKRVFVSLFAEDPWETCVAVLRRCLGQRAQTFDEPVDGGVGERDVVDGLDELQQAGEVRRRHCR